MQYNSTKFDAVRRVVEGVLCLAVTCRRYAECGGIDIMRLSEASQSACFSIRAPELPITTSRKVHVSSEIASIGPDGRKSLYQPLD